MMKRPDSVEPSVKLRTLVVDDQAAWRGLVCQSLEKDGRFQVDTAQSIDEAQQLLEANWYHILSLDINLDDKNTTPNTDGMKLLEDMHNAHAINQVMVVVMLSGNQVMANMNAAYSRFGISQFFTKDEDFDPLTFGDLLYDVFQRAIPWNATLEIQNTGSGSTLSDVIVGGQRLKWADEQKRNNIATQYDDLLRRLLHDADSAILTPMSPGKSGTGVEKAQPFYPTGGGRTMVIKYGETGRIKEEFDNYHQHVQHFSVGMSSTHIITTAWTPNLGGILYSHVGSIDQNMDDFEQFYDSHDTQEICNLLETLFTQVCRDWYVNRSPLKPLNLTALYQKTLGFTAAALEEMMAERLKTVQGKRELKFNNLPDVTGLRNPLLYLDRQFIRPAYECTTHGDLNQNNILIDGENKPWLIDFRKTGKSHCLRDIVFLDSVIRLQLLKSGDLHERYEMEQVLGQAQSPLDLDRIRTDYVATNPDLTKSFRVSVYLRRLAYELLGAINDGLLTDFYIAMFYTSLNSIRYRDLTRTQCEHALLVASMLIDRLPLN